MTSITITRRGNRLLLRALGHAAGAPEACCGVSTLLLSLAAWAEGRRGTLAHIAPGDLRLTLRGRRAMLAAEPVLRGLERLARLYPEAVRVLTDADAAGGAGEAADGTSPTRRADRLPDAPDALRLFDAGEGEGSAGGKPASGTKTGEAADGTDPTRRADRRPGDAAEEDAQGGDGADAPAGAPQPLPDAPQPLSDADADVPAAPLPDADAAVPAALLRYAAETAARQAAEAERARYAAEEAARREARARALAEAQSRRWALEAAALRARQPDFDLDAMRADPTFALLLTHGVPLERAWRAATVEQRERAARAEAERALSADIRARGLRPAEAGAGSDAAIDLRPDVRSLSDREVLDVLERLKRRERVSFG